MRIEGHRESSNVEDRRRRGLQVGGAVGGGGILLVLLAMLFGVDPSGLLDTTAPTDTAPLTDEDEAKKRFVGVVTASTEDVWDRLFATRGTEYRPPTVTLFRGAVHTACGTQQSQVGPFYCPGDGHVYLDVDFLELLQRRLGAPGDFAQAYVIAHEVGHHVQNLLGYADRVH